MLSLANIWSWPLKLTSDQLNYLQRYDSLEGQSTQVYRAGHSAKYQIFLQIGILSV